MKKLLPILACILLSAAAWAQTPNYDYPYFVTGAEGMLVAGNQVYCIPTFGDWDCDGDQDMMVGVFFNGNIWYYQNTAGAGQVPVFAAHTVVQADGSNISVTYGWCTTAAPQIVDWDNDGDKDLIVGENNGNVRYYQNIGTPSNPSLHYVGLMQAGGMTIDVGDYSTTCVNDWNEDGLPDLLVGESDGVINIFRNTGTLTNPMLGNGILLTLAAGGSVDVGYRSAPVVADFNGDGVKDLVSGEINGKLYYYQNNGTNANPQLATGVFLMTGNLQASTPGTSRPAKIDWNNDGHMDLVVGSYDARLKRFNWAATTPPAPTFDLTLTSSYMVPASGGTVFYTASANNGTSSTVNFDFWTQIQQPNYSWMDLFNRNGMSLSPGSSISRTMSLTVPASWTAGIYYYHGYVGNHAALQVYSTDYFYFYKNTTGDGPIVDEFSFTPWEDETPAVNVLMPQRPEISASPNPFNPSTTLTFDLIEDANVSISVYNVTGQQVAQLINAGYPVGQHQIIWDASGLPAGVYIVTLDAGKFHTAQKLTLLK